MYADGPIVFTSGLTTNYTEYVHVQFWIWKHNILADDSFQ